MERAKENLSTFWFVAFRERFDDSIVLLGGKLGVGLMPHFLRHVSQKRPTLADVSDGLRDLIAEHNAFDVELYRFAQERFEQKFPSPSEPAADVRELRARSAQVTEAAEKAREERKKRTRPRSGPRRTSAPPRTEPAGPSREAARRRKGEQPAVERRPIGEAPGVERRPR